MHICLMCAHAQTQHTVHADTANIIPAHMYTQSTCTCRYTHSAHRHMHTHPHGACTPTWCTPTPTHVHAHPHSTCMCTLTPQHTHTHAHTHRHTHDAHSYSAHTDTHLHGLASSPRLLLTPLRLGRPLWQSQIGSWGSACGWAEPKRVASAGLQPFGPFHSRGARVLASSPDGLSEP